MRAGRDEGPRRVGESLARLAGPLGLPAPPSVLAAVFSCWAEVAGAEIASHVRPVRVDGRTLVVAADHAAWATRIRMAASRIVADLNSAGSPDTTQYFERLEVLVVRA